MKQVKRWMGYAGFALVLAGCNATAHIEKDDMVDFTSYKSFDWLDKHEEGINNESNNNDLTEKKIMEAVNLELEKSGWKEEKKKKPDVLLRYDVFVESTVTESSTPVYSTPQSRVIYNPYTRRYSSLYYPSRFMGYESNQKQSREGTLTISMIDSKTDKLIWQGWATDDVRNKNLTSKEIQNSIRSIFKKFDVAKN